MDAPPNSILVVDDNENARNVLSALLKLYGYDVACAENGLDALHKLRSCPVPPNLILLDLSMPVMDGRTFLRRAREDRSVQKVPIIVMTGDPCGCPSGADAILSKPLNPEILRVTVRRYVKPVENSPLLSNATD